jgi:hypothetical protein
MANLVALRPWKKKALLDQLKADEFCSWMQANMRGL